MQCLRVTYVRFKLMKLYDSRHIIPYIVRAKCVIYCANDYGVSFLGVPQQQGKNGTLLLGTVFLSLCPSVTMPWFVNRGVDS